ncbi:Uncharacterized protein TCM_015239 [Theobroma cacao]|uniref:Uncharacterized protein n=1 Tax=Theobroma cacao TaxID=3641 RepID=A0A061G275_THECC|nr:Uncharacterized protein TCM_015239 [Theobroma cacao]
MKLRLVQAGTTLARTKKWWGLALARLKAGLPSCSIQSGFASENVGTVGLGPMGPVQLIGTLKIKER